MLNQLRLSCVVFFVFMFFSCAWCQDPPSTVSVDIATILSGEDISQVKAYMVKPGDNLERIAKKHKTTIELICAMNKLKTDLIRPGQKIKVWIEPLSIVVNKEKNILALKTGKEVVKVYSVATGVGNNTPVGEFHIASRFRNPVWFKKGVAIGPDDPQNALGPRWLGFDRPQYGIHGTIYPESIGKQASHGCVRMLNSDVIELYDIIPVGTGVVIVDN
jgi:lipoprotein-anchoring transpeptidase ErfK/SrfK